MGGRRFVEVFVEYLSRASRVAGALQRLRGDDDSQHTLLPRIIRASVRLLNDSDARLASRETPAAHCIRFILRRRGVHVARRHST